MPGDTIPISLEVQAGSEPIQGSLRVRDEPPRRFWGWLQLSALLSGSTQAGEEAGRDPDDKDDGQGPRPATKPRRAI